MIEVTKETLFKCENCGKKTLIANQSMDKALNMLLPDEFTLQTSFKDNNGGNYIYGNCKKFMKCFICSECGYHRIVFTLTKDSAKHFVVEKDTKEN